MAKRDRFVRAKGFFVTGTDTGVGKTLVAGAISRNLMLAGSRVGVFKPVATGCVRRREGLVSLDAEFLAHCSDSPFSLEQINPARYEAAVAPIVAAERSGRQIDWAAVALAYRNVAADSEVVVVEGIGGVMVPFSKGYLVLDLMSDMGLPIILVAGSGLGTINHTLLSLAACRQSGLHVAGIVLNGYQPDDATLAEETNAQVLGQLAHVEILTVIPYDKSSCVETGQIGADVLSAVGQVDWAHLAAVRQTKG